MNDHDSDTIRIQIKLTPKAARDAVSGWAEDEYGQPVLKCSVTAIPENGKANAALIKMLSKRLGIPKSAILLIKGDTSRIKTLDFQGINKNQFDQKIMGS